MTDLTEKWKAGELEEDWYYVQYQDNIIDIEFAQYHCWGRCSNVDIATVYFEQNQEIKKVLAPVPSYEELNALKEENARLKELLKNKEEALNLDMKVKDKLKELYPPLTVKES